MKHRTVGACLLLPCCFGSHAREGDTVKPVVNNQERSVARLKSASDEESFKIVDRLTQERYRFQEVILRELESTVDKEKKSYLVYLLGMYRMEGAVNALAQIIALEPKPRLNDALFLWDMYPAAEALAKIGNPSLRPMFDNLENSDDKLVRELSIRVIRAIEMPRIAKILIEQRIEEQKDAKKNARLKESLKLLPKQQAESVPR